MSAAQSELKQMRTKVPAYRDFVESDDMVHFPGQHRHLKSWRQSAYPGISWIDGTEGGELAVAALYILGKQNAIRFTQPLTHRRWHAP